MAETHFAWMDAWPHALVDVTASVKTSQDYKDITCEACLRELERRLTNSMQLQGPDEFPTGYYRYLARLELGLEEKDD